MNVENMTITQLMEQAKKAEELQKELDKLKAEESSVKITKAEVAKIKTAFTKIVGVAEILYKRDIIDFDLTINEKLTINPLVEKESTEELLEDSLPGQTTLLDLDVKETPQNDTEEEVTEIDTDNQEEETNADNEELEPLEEVLEVEQVIPLTKNEDGTFKQEDFKTIESKEYAEKLGLNITQYNDRVAGKAKEYSKQKPKFRTELKIDDEVFNITNIINCRLGTHYAEQGISFDILKDDILYVYCTTVTLKEFELLGLKACARKAIEKKKASGAYID